MNKKGQTNKMLGLVIMLFVMIILAVFVAKWWYGTTEKAGLERCLQSITIADSIGKSSEMAQEVFAPSIDCERQRMNINLEDYQDDDKKIDYTKLNTDLAENMMKFWQATGEGKKRPFEKWGDDQIACLIGYEVTFDKEFIEQQKKEGTQFKGFLDWTKTHAPSKSDKTYYETVSLMTFDGTIDTTQKYAVIMRADSDEASLKGIIATASVAATGGAIAGTFIPIPLVGTVAGGIIGGVGGAIVGAGIYLFAEGKTKSLLTTLVFIPEEAVLQKINIGDKEFPICENLYN